MVTETDQTTEATPVESGSTSEVSTQESQDSSSDQQAEAQSTEGTTEEVLSNSSPAAYTPNYKLKVYDEEKELDDPLLKSLIKDADTEKKVKEIAQKYLGFDTVKARNEKTREDFKKYQETTKPVVEYYNQASNMLKKGDLESFFDFLQIPNDAIFRYAVQKAEEANLDPQQRAYITQQKQITRQKEYLETQNQSLQQQQQAQLSQFRAQELNWVLARPDVHPVVQTYDSKNGPNAFRQLVRKVGLAHHADTNGQEDLSAEQATQEALKMIGAFVTPASVNGQPPAQSNQPIQQNGAPPIIPNVSGRGASPVKKQIRSFADLKKKRDELRSS